MSDPTQEKLTDHEYDGIREYDNPIPAWWSWIFAASILFAILYFMAYHMGTAGQSVYAAYDDDVKENFNVQYAALGTLTADEPTVARFMTDPQWLPVGQKIFQGNCISCHAADGSGLVGPNMTDDYYKNIKTLGDFPRVISEGAAGGAMPPWKTRLHPNEVVLVSAYVASLRGQNLKSVRPAEGVIIPPWPAAPAPGKP